MIVIGIILSIAGIGFLCWLLFRLAAYALPSFAAISAGLWAFDAGVGAVGAIALGLTAGALTLAVGQFIFTCARWPWLRVAVALLFAAPAAVAGYHATLGLAKLTMPAEAWQIASPSSARSSSARRPGRGWGAIVPPGRPGPDPAAG